MTIAQLQYQALAEPVAPVASPFNPGTGFGWIESEISPRQSQRSAQFANPLSYGEGVFTNPVVGVDSWEHFYPDWIRQLPRLTDRNCLSFTEDFFQETITLDKWNGDQNDPTRNKTKLPVWLGDYASELGVYINPTVNVDSWEHFYPDYLRPIPRLTDRNCLSFTENVFQEVIYVDKWNPDQNDPTRNRSRIPTWLGEEDLVLGVFINPNVGVDSWQHFYPDYIKPISRLTDSHGWDGTFLAAFGEVIYVDQWEHFYPDYLRPLQRLTDPNCLSFTEFTFNQVVTVDMWFERTSEPPRQLPRLTDREAWSGTFWAVFIAPFNPSTGFPWIEPEPQPRPIRRELYGHSDPAFVDIFIIPTVNVDSWEHFYPDWIRHLPRLTDRDCLHFTEFTFSEVITIDKWNPDQCDPTRNRSKLPTWLEEFGYTTFIETIYVDQWEHFYPDYIKQIPRLTDRNCLSFTEFTFNEIITVDKWFQPTSLPTKPIPHLTDREAWFGTFYAIFVPPFDASQFPQIESDFIPKRLNRDFQTDNQEIILVTIIPPPTTSGAPIFKGGIFSSRIFGIGFPS